MAVPRALRRVRASTRGCRAACRVLRAKGFVDWDSLAALMVAVDGRGVVWKPRS